ncbi:hypothetical protein C8F01DRAFT_982130, partial [Mycena amicta]
LAPGFPRNLWKAVLLDEYVDFDAILTSTYAVEADESDQFVVGEDYLEVKKPKLVSRISDRGQWITAFWTWYEAVIFAFPERRTELQTYFRHINDTFSSKSANVHWRVINYDRAARVHICRTKALLFDDISELTGVRDAHLSNNGVRVNAPQPNGNRKLPGKSPAKARRAPPDGQQREYDANEVCRRYNRNECTRGTTCRFRHACSGCDGDGHAANDCPDKQRR